MRIAVLIIGLAVSLIVLLQSCAANLAGALASQSLKQGAAVGMLLALFYIIGAGFAMRLPIVSIVVFAFGAIIAISAGHNSDFGDLQVWGWLSAILAILSYFGHRERKNLQVKLASGGTPTLKNEPTTETEIATSPAVTNKTPSPATFSSFSWSTIVLSALVLGAVAFVIVFYYPQSPSQQPTQPAQVSAPPKPEARELGSLSGSDLPMAVKTYRENEMRFKRDLVGKPFADVLPFKNASENVIFKGAYTVRFGKGFTNDVNCTVTSPLEISTIANWKDGDQIRVVGNVKDVTLGSVNLESCRLSR